MTDLCTTSARPRGSVPIASCLCRGSGQPKSHVARVIMGRIAEPGARLAEPTD